MNFLKVLLFSLVAIGAVATLKSGLSEADVPSPQTLKWHSLQDLEVLQEKTPKKVIIDVYTDWCGWCKHMDKQTFTDAELIKYLNDNYYMVKFNAEDQSTVQFKGKEFNYVASGRRGYNEFAAALLQGRLSYPAFVVLDETSNPVNIIRGFKEAGAFRAALESTSL
jgi:thioredoxin-related protein